MAAKRVFFGINCANTTFKFKPRFCHYEYCARLHEQRMCVCASQPNFRISPLIGRMHLWMQFNAVRASHMHVWSIPSRSRFINLMPFRFHFVCAQIHFFGAKSLSEIWNRFDSHKESIKIMQFRLISQLCRASINAAFCTHEQYRIVNSVSHRMWFIYLLKTKWKMHGIFI